MNNYGEFISYHARNPDWKACAIQSGISIPEAKAYIESEAGKHHLAQAKRMLDMTDPDGAAERKFVEMRKEILQRANERLEEMLSKESDDIHELMLNATEAQAFRKLLGDNPSESMIQWYLKTKHKSQGYTEKVDVDTTHTHKVEVDSLELSKRYLFLINQAKVEESEPQNVSGAE